MLALARALAVSPKLVIADEMSLGLAPLVAESVFEGLEEAAGAGHHHRAERAVRPPCAGHGGPLRDPDPGPGGLVRPASEAGQEVIDRYLGEAERATPAAVTNGLQ